MNEISKINLMLILIVIGIFLMSCAVTYISLNHKHTEKGDCFDKRDNKIQGVFCDVEVFDSAIWEILTLIIILCMFLLLFTAIGLICFLPYMEEQNA